MILWCNIKRGRRIMTLESQVTKSKDGSVKIAISGGKPSDFDLSLLQEVANWVMECNEHTGCLANGLNLSNEAIYSLASFALETNCFSNGCGFTQTTACWRFRVRPVRARRMRVRR